MDLWSVVFGMLIMLEAVLVFDGLALWRQGEYKEATLDWVAGGHLWAAFFIHHRYGFHTTDGLLLLVVISAVYYLIYKCLQPSKS